jgi:hypothetical protein
MVSSLCYVVLRKKGCYLTVASPDNWFRAVARSTFIVAFGEHPERRTVAIPERVKNLKSSALGDVRREQEAPAAD